jgi:hypothetical protein
LSAGKAYPGTQSPLVEKPNNIRPLLPGKAALGEILALLLELAVPILHSVEESAQEPFWAKYIWSPPEFRLNWADNKA